MATYKGPGFSYSTNFDRVAIQLRETITRVEQSIPAVLKAIGVQAVAWVVQDYRERSTGASVGGVAWKPLTESAIRTRLAGRTPWQRQRDQLIALREEERPILERLRRMLPSDKSKQINGDKAKGRRVRGFLAREFEKKNPELRKIRKKRQTIRSQRKAAIAKELSSAQIGVDTGRLVNSLVFGVPELASIKTPKSAPSEKALFEVQGQTINIGSVMKYAKHYDALRPIFTPDFIDQQRRESLERTIEKVVRLSTGDKS